MMGWVDFARGTARVRVTGAYPQTVLNRLAAQRIPFWDIVRRDEMTLEMTVYRAQVAACRQAAQRAMCDLSPLSFHGARAVFYGLKRRPVLLIGLLLALAVALWSQQYIWTLEVQGNETVPSAEILRAMAELGVRPGTRWSRIDPQRLENRMLDRLASLSWFTINANGARAMVLVRERVPVPELVDSRQPTNVVASQSGLIEQMEVYDGQPVVEPGQIVVEGQLLVSGLTSSFRATVLHHAMAEIYARTWRPAEIVSGKTRTVKTYTGASRDSWRLIIGNKFIKFFGNSRISAEPCDKMIATYPLTLPGGLVLPIALEKTTCRFYTSAAAALEPEPLQARMQEEYAQWLRGEMVAGQILTTDGTLSEEDALWRLRVVCECTEQIGQLAPILINTKEDERG